MVINVVIQTKIKVYISELICIKIYVLTRKKQNVSDSILVGQGCRNRQYKLSGLNGRAAIIFSSRGSGLKWGVSRRLFLLWTVNENPCAMPLL